MKIMSDVVAGRKGDWMQLSSGGKFFPMDPRSEEFNIDDIANGLALTCRFGGQGRVDKFYSVAEHSFLMAIYALGDHRTYYTFALCALLHDAAEAYVGDLIRSVKKAVGESYTDMEDKIQQTIMKRYNLYEESKRFAPSIKLIDNRIIVNEKAALFETSQRWFHDSLAPLSGVEIKCHHPAEAKRLWLDLFFELREKQTKENLYERSIED